MKLTRKEIIKRLDKLRQTYARYEGARGGGASVSAYGYHWGLI